MYKLLNVKTLGSDGAFSNNHSSFLVEYSYEKEKLKILFDCGENVFHKVKDEDIDCIFISHTHFDHIAGLETLIYYRYFVKGLKTTIASGDKVIQELKEHYLKDVNNVFDNGKLLPVDMVEFLDESKMTTKYPFMGVLEANHIAKVNYSMVLEDYEEVFVISGDTKAFSKLQNLIEKCLYENKYITIYHDYSEWNDITKNIHCCKTDFDIYYKKYFDNSKVIFYKYHTPKANVPELLVFNNTENINDIS